MPLLSLTPILNKVLKECFKTNIEYTFTSVRGGNNVTTQEVKKKVPILHQVVHLEALLIWRATYEELAQDKNWTPMSKLTNARLLLSGNCKQKWNMCVRSVIGIDTPTNNLINDTIVTVMQQYSSYHDTQRLRDQITNAKKPTNMSIRDFVSQIEEINGYLPFMLPPLNTPIDEEQLVIIIRRAVPHWNNKLDQSAVFASTIQEVTSYYQNLQEVELRTSQRNNNNNSNNTYNNGNQRDKVSRYNNNNGNNDRNNDRHNNNGNNNNRNNNNSNNRSNNNNNNNDNRTNRYNNNNNSNGNSNRNNNSNNNSIYNNNRNNNNNYNNNNNSNRNNNGTYRRNEINRIEGDEEDNQSQMSYQSTTSRKSTRSTNSRRLNEQDEIYVFEEILSVEKVDAKNKLTLSTEQINHKQIMSNNDFRPEIVVRIDQNNETKSKKIIRALIDTGSTVTVVRDTILSRNHSLQKSNPRTFTTMGGTMTTSGITKINFALLQFAPHRIITHEVAVLPSTNHQLGTTEMIIGRDLTKSLGLVLDYSTEIPTINWDGLTVPITQRGYWNTTKIAETFSMSVIETAEKNFENRSPSMIAANYGNKSTSLLTFIPKHLTSSQQTLLLRTLTKYSTVFDGTLGTLPGKPVSLRLKADNVRPYHGRAFPVPRSHDNLIKTEIQRLVTLGVLEKCNTSEWAAPSFGIPKKNGQIRFVSDFRQLNKHLLRLPFPLPNPQQLFRTMDGFSYCTTMDLNMGFWTICLDEHSKNLCTIILPWGKYRYL